MNNEILENKSPDTKLLNNLREYIDEYPSPKVILTANELMHRADDNFSGNKCHIHISGDHYQLLYIKGGNLVMIKLKLNEISEFAKMEKFNICQARDFFRKINMNLIGEISSAEIPDTATVGHVNKYPDGKDGTMIRRNHDKLI